MPCLGRLLMTWCFSAILLLSLGGHPPAQDTWVGEQNTGWIPAPLIPEAGDVRQHSWQAYTRQPRASTSITISHPAPMSLLTALFSNFFLNLFIYFWLCWVFVSVRGLSLVAASGGHSSSRCAGLSLLRPLVAEHRLQTRRLSSCGSRA